MLALPQWWNFNSMGQLKVSLKNKCFIGLSLTLKQFIKK